MAKKNSQNSACGAGRKFFLYIYIPCKCNEFHHNRTEISTEQVYILGALPKKKLGIFLLFFDA